MTLISRLSDTTQTITFSEEDEITRVEVFANDVEVTTTSGAHNHGSSKLKLKNMVDYLWEPKYYPGQLLALHRSGYYLAYTIKVASSGTCMVRVTHLPSEMRELLKGMKGEVHDLAFAQIDNEIILASIDEKGCIFVHQIQLMDKGLKCTLIMEMLNPTDHNPSVWHKINWCPYVPDTDDSEEDYETAKLLISIHNKYACIWNVAQAVNKRASCITITGSEPLSQALLSPDATALAVAQFDGTILFYQVSDGSPPKCLQKWQPHNGRPVTTLFFLDNIKSCTLDDQFWKCAVTGTDNNTELKIWSCKTWSCLQTIRFTHTTDFTVDYNFGLKPVLDLTANYMLMSDFQKRTMYVLEIAQDSDDLHAYVKCVSEFLLPYPILGMAIAHAGVHMKSLDKEYNSNGAQLTDEDESNSDSENIVDSDSGMWEQEVVVKAYVVQPKGLQRARLTFPATLIQQDIHESMSQTDDIQTRNLKDMLLRAQKDASSLMSQASTEPAHSLNLMTPDAFSSPTNIEKSEPLPPLPTVTDDENSIRRPSQSSSPSREVQLIMCPSYVSPPPPNITGNEKNWPSISIEQINEANQRRLSSDKTANAVAHSAINVNENLSIKEESQVIVHSNQELTEAIEKLSISVNDQSRIISLEEKLDQLTEAVNSMQHRIEKACKDGDMGGAAARAAGTGAARALEPLVRALQHELASKMTATDILLQSNIEKLAKSKSVTENIAQAVAHSLTESLRDTFRDAIMTTLVPVMEKAHGQMLKQISITFQQGAKEFVAKAESAALAAVERSASSAAATPRPASVQATISSLLESGDIDAAFQRALSAADLSLVTTTCRAVEPGPAVAALRPHVLLSLIQQLAAELGTETDLKTRYLEEAVTRLSSEGGGAHGPSVLRELRTRLITYVARDPVPTASLTTRSLRMLQLAVDGLLKQIPTQ